MGDYQAIRALHRGETIDIGGIKLKMAEGPIRAGDLYMGERNSDPKLLTAKKIVMLEDDSDVDFIVPTCNSYPYDGPECVKVCEA